MVLKLIACAFLVSSCIIDATSIEIFKEAALSSLGQPIKEFCQKYSKDSKAQIIMRYCNELALIAHYAYSQGHDKDTVLNNAREYTPANPNDLLFIKTGQRSNGICAQVVMKKEWDEIYSKIVEDIVKFYRFENIKKTITMDWSFEDWKWNPVSFVLKSEWDLRRKLANSNNEVWFEGKIIQETDKIWHDLRFEIEIWYYAYTKEKVFLGAITDYHQAKEIYQKTLNDS